MQAAVFSAKPFDRDHLTAANAGRHDLLFLPERLSPRTASLAPQGCAVCPFANDDVGAETLEALCARAVRLIALRSAGFNHVDLHAADRLGMTVLRVPAYSPHSVAEHTVGLMLTLNRKLHRAYARVREQNFALDGLMGFDFHGRTVGVIGTGKIGEIVAKIMLGFGCRVLAADPVVSDACARMGVEYTSIESLLEQADIVTIHCPLTPSTRYLIDADAIARMKRGVMLINTSRGAVIDTKAVINALKSKHIGYLGLDVYEEEADLFFKDLSDEVIEDEVFMRLLTFPNVVITAHQAFFTREAVANIARTTIDNITAYEQRSVDEANRVTARLIKG